MSDKTKADETLGGLAIKAIYAVAFCLLCYLSGSWANGVTGKLSGLQDLVGKVVTTQAVIQHDRSSVRREYEAIVVETNNKLQALARSAAAHSAELKDHDARLIGLEAEMAAHERMTQQNAILTSEYRRIIHERLTKLE